MPRLSAEQLAARRQQILEAALRRFARDGFHATTMDDVIAEAGLSAGAVYRYFPSKAGLIAEAAAPAFALAQHVVRELADTDPVPSPAEAVAVLVDAVAELSLGEGFDISRLAITAWGEALRDPEVAALARRIYGEMTDGLERLVRVWQEQGSLPPDAEPGEVASALFSLVPGFMLQRVFRGTEAASYARGAAALLGTPRRPTGPPPHDKGGLTGQNAATAHPRGG